MTRFQINLQTASRQGYAFAIVSKAIWLGCVSNVDYIISKHKTEASARRAFNQICNGWVGQQTDVRLISTEAGQ